MRYVCSICGYVYDEAGNAPWADIPEDWKCPLCGAAKSDFAPEGASGPSKGAGPGTSVPADIKPLTAAETSALCSNLAKGCEKQYKPEQAAAFRKLADWFASRAPADPNPSFERLLALIDDDLNRNFPSAHHVSAQCSDRGALRALTWSGKVTRILKSLLARYAREGDAMLENTGIYVCTICGFVYIGSNPPEVCPVCRVPGRKFEKIGG